MRKCGLSVLMLVSVFILFCGCSDRRVAGKRLQNEQKSLAEKYISKVFAGQSKLNSNYAVWCTAVSNTECVTGGRTFMAGFDGVEVFNREADHKLLDEYAVARFYAAQELELLIKGIVSGAPAPYEHEKYTFRSFIKLSVTENRRLWKHAPGVSIGIAALKNDKKSEAVKLELKNTVSKYLPPEKTDYFYLNRQKSDLVSRDYEVVCFICYDPALPGWVLEDNPQSTDLSREAGSWFDGSWQVPAEVTQYNNQYYWKDSALFRKNYDKGLVLFRGRWMSAELASATLELEKLCDEFDPAACDVEALQDFLGKVSKFSAECDRNPAWKKAATAAGIIINKLQQGNEFEKLRDLLTILTDDAEFAPIREQCRPHCEKAMNIAMQNLNKQLTENISMLNRIGKKIDEIFADPGQRQQKRAIALSRLTNVYSNIVPENKQKFAAEIVKMQFAAILLAGTLEDASGLYQNVEDAVMLKEISPALLRDCPKCRRGITRCIYCRESKGQCTGCRGEKFVNNDFCRVCRGSGKCEKCGGSLRIKCLSCAGRGFFIRKEKVQTLLKESSANIGKLLQNNIQELEKRRVKAE